MLEAHTLKFVQHDSAYAAVWNAEMFNKVHKRT